LVYQQGSVRLASFAIVEREIDIRLLREPA
jgi:hypothetical protein